MEQTLLKQQKELKELKEKTKYKGNLSKDGQKWT
jgi:hypothetical protein